MLSPADEEPVEPHDAWADDLRLAEAAAGLEGLVDMRCSGSSAPGAACAPSRRTGLPVVGFDPDADGFFWLAGQGGYGIQTSPALSKLAAALVAAPRNPGRSGARGNRTEPLSPCSVSLTLEWRTLTAAPAKGTLRGGLRGQP